MEFNRFTTDPVEAFGYLRVNINSDTIFKEFAEYVTKSDIEKYIMQIENIETLPDNMPPIELYKRLPSKFSYTELLNGFIKFFTKSELALFDEYLFSMYDVD